LWLLGHAHVSQLNRIWCSTKRRLPGASSICLKSSVRKAYRRKGESWSQEFWQVLRYARGVLRMCGDSASAEMASN
jgi:hypothetical protein